MKELIAMTTREHVLHQAGLKLGYAAGVNAVAKAIVETGRRYRDALAGDKKRLKRSEEWLTLFDQMAEHVRASAAPATAEGKRLLDSLSTDAKPRRKNRFLRAAEALLSPNR